MSINTKQLIAYIIDPTLKELGFFSENDRALVLGTCAQESNMGSYIKQLRGGVACGIYQMEPNTYYDILGNWLQYRPRIANKICMMLGVLNENNLTAERMISDMTLATAMCRLHYLRVKEPIPAAHDIEGLANYWKKYYNTPAGKGTVDEFMMSYNKYVADFI